jgi:1,4-dihydroxy-2-naphthoate octaprenyltransferase
MFGGLLDWMTSLASMVLMGAAVKLMDDYLDSEYDICRGERTIAVKIGRATLPYALVCALISSYFNVSIAVSIFLASYALGMLTNAREKLPTKVPAYMEIVISLLVLWAMVGWRTGLWALSFMALIDWLDDVIDMTRDQRTGQRNLALKIGLVETTLLILIAMCTSVLTNAKFTAIGFIAFAVLTAVAELSTSRMWHHGEDHHERVDT